MTFPGAAAMRRIAALPLQAKLFVVGAAMLAATCALLTAIAVWDIERLLAENLARKGLSHAVLLDRQGAVLAAAGWDVAARGLPASGGPVVAADGALMLAFAMPVAAEGAPMGTLHFGLSLDPLHRLRDEALWRAGLAATAVLALMLLAMAWTNRRLMAPLGGLRRASERIRAGLYGVDLPHGRADDLGALCDSMRAMGAEIARRIAALEEIQDAQRALLAQARTREGDLAAAKNRAEAASRAKAEFLARMSHELRTPLNAIIGFAEVIATTAANPALAAKHAEYARDIHASGSHLLEMIEAILELTQLDTDRRVFAAADIDLAAAIDQARRLAAADLEAHAIAVEVDVAGDGAAACVGDATAIRQILVNLLGNAARHARPGSAVRIRVRAGAARIACAVATQGPHYPQHVLARLGTAFLRPAQGDGFVSAREGLGLGLAICHELARRQNGSLALRNLPDGAEAILELPRRVAEARPLLQAS
jgi:signal transduction histidine kinase